MKIDRPWNNEYQKYNIAHQLQLPAQHESLLEMLEQSFQQYRNAAAFIFYDQILSFTELDQLSLRFASYLQQLNLAQQTRIAIMLPNLLQYPVIACAILRAGYIAVNVNPHYTTRELQYQLNDSGAEVLIIIDDAIPTFQHIEAQTKVKTIIQTSISDLLTEETVFKYPHLQENKVIQHELIGKVYQFKSIMNELSSTHYQRPELQLHDIALLQYTGGTTGLSKGTILTHGNLFINTLQMDAAFSSNLLLSSQGGSSRILCLLPFYHIFAFSFSILYSLYSGQTVVLILNPREINYILDTWRRYSPNVFPGVNTIFNTLANQPDFKEIDFSDFKLAVSGGMPTLQATADLWQQLTGNIICEVYGLSETGPLATFNPKGQTTFSGKVGIPVPLTDVVIIDEHGNQLPYGQPGEVAIRGPQVMQGYWQKIEETAQVMTRDQLFRSGDIGIMDERGYIELIDRKKDMIVVSGFNVYPREIEEVVAQYYKVLEVAAIGIKDEKSGEVPKIFIVSKDPSLTEDEILSHIRANLTAYKCPKYIEFVHELPKSNIGKILRRHLKEQQ
ncbi:long-chain acyl-CoA synthetase [Acinetobacter colistiniresistens]|uniref:Long-chain-fatty-acid--CoA ligase n=1 Tax=Acinetobacter colistiniresistens TaxID=280145 RepID=S3T0V4_9GAMM|nr:long-chain acyl-CoA synthetase [Acinetobacter colistiniresistens]TVT87533.1 long-chain-fatty-acid--CoA ligase [Acinetobacter colistiniresistens]